MTDKPIDFERAKRRRIEATIGADQAHWQAVHRQLMEVMAASELSGIALTSAALRALLDILMADDDVNLDDAKQRIAKSLDCFF